MASHTTIFFRTPYWFTVHGISQAILVGTELDGIKLLCVRMNDSNVWLMLVSPWSVPKKLLCMCVWFSEHNSECRTISNNSEPTQIIVLVWRRRRLRYIYIYKLCSQQFECCDFLFRTLLCVVYFGSLVVSRANDSHRNTEKINYPISFSTFGRRDGDSLVCNPEEVFDGRIGHHGLQTAMSYVVLLPKTYHYVVKLQ